MNSVPQRRSDFKFGFFIRRFCGETAPLTYVCALTTTTLKYGPAPEQVLPTGTCVSVYLTGTSKNDMDNVGHDGRNVLALALFLSPVLPVFWYMGMPYCKDDDWAGLSPGQLAVDYSLRMHNGLLEQVSSSDPSNWNIVGKDFVLAQQIALPQMQVLKVFRSRAGHNNTRGSNGALLELQPEVAVTDTDAISVMCLLTVPKDCKDAPTSIVVSEQPAHPISPIEAAELLRSIPDYPVATELFYVTPSLSSHDFNGIDLQNALRKFALAYNREEAITSRSVESVSVGRSIVVDFPARTLLGLMPKFTSPFCPSFGTGRPGSLRSSLAEMRCKWLNGGIWTSFGKALDAPLNNGEVPLVGRLVSFLNAGVFHSGVVMTCLHSEDGEDDRVEIRSVFTVDTVPPPQSDLIQRLRIKSSTLLPPLASSDGRFLLGAVFFIPTQVVSRLSAFTYVGSTVDTTIEIPEPYRDRRTRDNTHVPYVAVNAVAIHGHLIDASSVTLVRFDALVPSALQQGAQGTDLECRRISPRLTMTVGELKRHRFLMPSGLVSPFVHEKNGEVVAPAGRTASRLIHPKNSAEHMLWAATWALLCPAVSQMPTTASLPCSSIDIWVFQRSYPSIPPALWCSMLAGCQQELWVHSCLKDERVIPPNSLDAIGTLPEIPTFRIQMCELMAKPKPDEIPTPALLARPFAAAHLCTKACPSVHGFVCFDNPTRPTGPTGGALLERNESRLLALQQLLPDPDLKSQRSMGQQVSIVTGNQSPEDTRRSRDAMATMVCRGLLEMPDFRWAQQQATTETQQTCAIILVRTSTSPGGRSEVELHKPEVVPETSGRIRLFEVAHAGQLLARHDLSRNSFSENNEGTRVSALRARTVPRGVCRPRAAVKQLRNILDSEPSAEQDTTQSTPPSEQTGFRPDLMLCLAMAGKEDAEKAAEAEKQQAANLPEHRRVSHQMATAVTDLFMGTMGTMMPPAASSFGTTAPPPASCSADADGAPVLPTANFLGRAIMNTTATAALFSRIPTARAPMFAGGEIRVTTANIATARIASSSIMPTGALPPASRHPNMTTAYHPSAILLEKESLSDVPPPSSVVPESDASPFTPDFDAPLVTANLLCEGITLLQERLARGDFSTMNDVVLGILCMTGCIKMKGFEDFRPGMLPLKLLRQLMLQNPFMARGADEIRRTISGVLKAEIGSRVIIPPLKEIDSSFGVCRSSTGLRVSCVQPLPSELPRWMRQSPGTFERRPSRLYQLASNSLDVDKDREVPPQKYPTTLVVPSRHHAGVARPQNDGFATPIFKRPSVLHTPNLKAKRNALRESRNTPGKTPISPFTSSHLLKSSATNSDGSKKRKIASLC